MNKNKTRNQKIVSWTGRISAIFLTSFFILYTLSILRMNYSPIEIEFAFIVSLILTIFLVINLFISWKWETIGGFIYFALFYIFIFIHSGNFKYFVVGFFFPGRTSDFNYQILLPFLYWSTSLVIIGVLFLYPDLRRVLRIQK